MEESADLLNRPAKEESISQMKRELLGTVYEKLIPLVKDYGTAAQPVLEILHKVAKAIKQGNLDEMVLYSDSPLLKASIDPENGDYPSAILEQTLAVELQARRDLFETLEPKPVAVLDPDDNKPMLVETEVKSEILFMNPQSDLVFSLVPEGRVLALKAVSTSINNLYIVQFFRQIDNDIKCDERLVHIPQQYLEKYIIPISPDIPKPILGAPVAWDELPGRKTPDPSIQKIQATVLPLKDKIGLN